MSETEDVEYLKNRLKLLYEINIVQKKNLSSDFFLEFLDIMDTIKTECLYALKYEVFQFLDSNSEQIRSEAVATLGLSSRLFLPEFKDKVFEIFINDPSDIVKATALSCWCGYYIETKNKKVIITLYKILIDNNIETHIRAYAYNGIFTTIKRNAFTMEKINEWDKLLSVHTAEEFNHNVNWDAVNKLMLQYAPEALKE